MKRLLRLNHIIFFAVATVAVVALVSFWAICNHRVFGMMTDRVVEDTTRTIAAVQRNMETLVSYTEDFSKYLSVDEQIQRLMEVRDWASEADRVRSEIVTGRDWGEINTRMAYSTSRLAGFGAYTDQGLMYSYFKATVPYHIDIIPEADLLQAQRQKEPLWTDLMILKSKNAWYYKEEPAFAVLKYVQDSRGRHLGTIALFIRETGFSDILLSAGDRQNGQLYLVDGAGDIVSSVDKSDLYRPAMQALEVSEADYGACLEAGQLLKPGPDGAPVLYMTREIGGTPFRLVGRIVLDDLRLQQRKLSMFMLATLLVTLAAALAASWFVSKQVVRPIRQIISVMRRIEDSPGAEKAHCPVSGVEEIGQLSLEFNRLMEKVDASTEKIYQEQRQRRHNEVRLLQAQIVPHFLYNTLGMISAMINLGDAKQAQEALQNLATFYRRSLSGGSERIPLEEEIELTRSYLALQRMRYIEYIDYEIEHDPAASRFIVPKLLIQPLVENVLNHGLRTDGQKCLITIRTRYDPASGSCVIAVWDTGRGMSEARLKEIRDSLERQSSLSRSFGLTNVAERMKLVYGERFSMQVESEEGAYTRFTLRIQDPDTAL
ncbi:MAG: sensor histidine kinase [Clostridia bacterium]|nr:sensor histidine kinase [Clostridia bacterium]